MAIPERSLAATVPQYGTVEAAGWLLVLAAVVARASVALVETVRVVWPAAPGVPLRAVPWLLLAVVGVGVAVLEVRRQRRSNPNTFIARGVRETFLEQHRLGARRALLALAATGGGAATVLRARTEFRTALDGFLFLAKRFLADGTLVTVRPVNAALGLGFLVGVGLLTRGVDRLLVGLLREVLYLWHRNGE